MHQIFHREKKANFIWGMLEDLDFHTKKLWEQLPIESGLFYSDKILKYRDDMEIMNQEINKYSQLIKFIREQIGQLSDYSDHIYLFLVADVNGKCIDVIGDKETLLLLENHNVGIGTSFSIKHAGINAISFCMEINKPVIIEGKEHFLELFSSWTCICLPIKKNCKTIAYLDLSFACNINSSFPALLLDQIVKGVEMHLKQISPQYREELVLERFTPFKLTPRENEIGYRWLTNQTTDQIAAELHLSEGTVRNIIKRVYAKVGVNGRSQFIHNFIPS